MKKKLMIIQTVRALCPVLAEKSHLNSKKVRYAEICKFPSSKRMMRVGQKEYLLKKIEILNLYRRKNKILKSMNSPIIMIRLEK